MSVIIRPAVASDQEIIRALIRRAHLNTTSLRWQNFLVAEDGGRIVGLRQVKTHSGGTLEVASGYVLPEYRRQGLSARLMQQLLAAHSSPLYLMCNEKWMPYYEGFGFRRLPVNELPRDFQGEYKRGRFITSLLSIFLPERIRLIPMKRVPVAEN